MPWIAALGRSAEAGQARGSGRNMTSVRTMHESFHVNAVGNFRVLNMQEVQSPLTSTP